MNDFEKAIQIAKDEMIRRIYSITVDIYYYDWFLEQHNEDDLRNQLKEENDKRVFDKNGEKQIMDNRDISKIKKIELLIEKIEKVTKEREQHSDTLEGVKQYLALIEKDKNKIIKVLQSSI